MCDLIVSSSGNYVAAVLPRSRTKVHDAVTGAHYLPVMLHHQHGISQVAQTMQNLNQSLVSRLCSPIDGSSNT